MSKSDFIAYSKDPQIYGIMLVRRVLTSGQLEAETLDGWVCEFRPDEVDTASRYFSDTLIDKARADFEAEPAAA